MKYRDYKSLLSFEIALLQLIIILITASYLFPLINQLLRLILYLILLTAVILQFIKNILHTAKLEKREFVLSESQKVAHIGSFIIDIINNKWIHSEELDQIFGIDEIYDSSLDSFINIVHSDWKAKIINYFSYVYYERKRFDCQYKIIRVFDGAERWVHMLGEIGYESNGKISNMIGTIQDITEQKKVADELEYISYHDSLTGLSNRRKFEIVLENANNSGRFPVSIIMGDANGLKLVNDAFGHINGDNILVRIAQIMKEECGNNACVARHGGDEFAAILDGVSYEEASLIVNRIQKRCLDETTVELMLNVSFGLGTKEKENDDLKNCYHLAEERMYAGKILETKITRGEIIANLQILMEERTGVTQEQRVKIVEMAQRFGEQLGMQSFEVQYLKQLVLWYDIGKTGVTDKISFNQGKLPQEEQRILDRHCEIGYRIANTIPELVPIAEGILSHHERWDGDGYPHKLKDNDIPLMSRIVAILDTYITLTNNRSYRKALSVGEATEEIKRFSGTQFDPRLTKVFIEKVLGQECKILV